MNLILACDSNYGIGIQNKLPWSIKDDLKHFKKITSSSNNNVVIMGKNTYLSFKKPLPNRINIVVSRSLASKKFSLDGFLFFDSFEFAYLYAKNFTSLKNNSGEIFIIGGAQLYDYVIQNYEINKLYLTYINNKYNCDVFLHYNTVEFFKKIKWNNINTIKDKNIDICFYSYIKSD